jgi:predicted nucleic acid-binding protein
MAILLDTNVLVRLANAADASFAVALDAVTTLHGRSEIIHITAQNLIEFRSVATRPLSMNGLGFDSLKAEIQAAEFEAAFPLLPETPEIFLAWKSLIGATGAIGKQVHDARLVAVCHAHRISHLMTFNVGHFARYAACAPGVTVINPRAV